MMRNELEKEKANRLKAMEVACQSTNQQLLENKIGREKYDKERDSEDKLNHIDYVNNNDFYTENTVLVGLCRQLANQCWAGTGCLTTIGKGWIRTREETFCWNNRGKESRRSCKKNSKRKRRSYLLSRNKKTGGLC